MLNHLQFCQLTIAKSKRKPTRSLEKGTLQRIFHMDSALPFKKILLLYLNLFVSTKILHINLCSQCTISLPPEKKDALRTNRS